MPIMPEWWRNLRQQPGFGAALSQAGLYMLSAPSLHEGLGGLGLMAGQMRQFQEDEEEKEALRKKREAEDRLAALRIRREELENEDLPDRIADQAAARDQALRAGEQDYEKNKVDIMAKMFGLETAKEDREAEEIARKARERIGGAINPDLAAVAAVDPELSRQIAVRGLPPTEDDILNRRAKEANIRAIDSGIENARLAREQADKQLEAARKRSEQANARVVIEQGRLRLKELDASILEERGRLQSITRGKRDPTEDEASSLKNLELERAQMMNKYNRATQILLGAQRELGKDPRSPDVVLSEMSKTIPAEEAENAMERIVRDGRLEEFFSLVEGGMSHYQAYLKMYASPAAEVFNPNAPVSVMGGGGF